MYRSMRPHTVDSTNRTSSTGGSSERFPMNVRGKQLVQRTWLSDVPVVWWLGCLSQVVARLVFDARMRAEPIGLAKQDEYLMMNSKLRVFDGDDAPRPTHTAINGQRPKSKEAQAWADTQSRLRAACETSASGQEPSRVDDPRHRASARTMGGVLAIVAGIFGLRAEGGKDSRSFPLSGHGTDCRNCPTERTSAIKSSRGQASTSRRVSDSPADSHKSARQTICQVYDQWRPRVNPTNSLRCRSTRTAQERPATCGTARRQASAQILRIARPDESHLDSGRSLHMATHLRTGDWRLVALRIVPAVDLWIQDTGAHRVSEGQTATELVVYPFRHGDHPTQPARLTTRTAGSCTYRRNNAGPNRTALPATDHSRAGSHRLARRRRRVHSVAAIFQPAGHCFHGPVPTNRSMHSGKRCRAGPMCEPRPDHHSNSNTCANPQRPTWKGTGQDWARP